MDSDRDPTGDTDREGTENATGAGGQPSPDVIDGSGVADTDTDAASGTAADQPGGATDPPTEAETEEESGEAKAKKKKDKKKGLGTSRGIETMFRTSYRVHQDLVGLADAKANIMISVNGLIISIILATVSPRIGSIPLLMLPVSVLLIGCLVALVYAVLAARPRVSNTPLTLDDITRNDANILFFGNFVNLSEDDFVEGMRNLMMTPDHLYVNMVRDLYGLGQVLKKKFQLLRISYTVFMFALVAGVLLFLVVFAMDATLGGDLLDSSATLPLLP
jgi:hypothetical protein